ncbi:MAG TPA: IS110 family transposase, partial [Microthrixaceae bacterium]|nr:IS110 family transposase [Microthrixaceae bacterium]
MTSTITDPMATVTVGVDTHKDIHVAAVLDDRAGVLETAEFPTTAAGYNELLRWATSHGQVQAFGVEGTGSWGAGLSRHLQHQGLKVIEVNCTNRQHRRRHGKSDTADAIGAARAVLSGQADAVAKTGTGPVEAVRMLRVTLRSAIKSRTQAINQIHSILDTAAPRLRDEFRSLSTRELVTRCARLRPSSDVTNPDVATKTALRSLARRYQHLTAEIKELRPQLKAAVTAAAPPELLAEYGVGTDTAAALLIAAGDNPDRMHSDAAFASLCGVSPVDVSSGRQQRHRLNRGGNRDANSALWRIVLVKMANDPETCAYIKRRIAQGNTKREAI